LPRKQWEAAHQPFFVQRILATTHAQIELLTMIKDHNAAPWQKAVVREADAELTKLLRGGEQR